MRKKIRKIAGPVMMAAMLLFSGCADKKNNDRNDKEQAQEELEEDLTEEELSKEEITDADDQEELQEAGKEEDGEEKDDEKEPEIPNESSLHIDYTTVDGLRMEKGSRIAVVIKNTETAYWKAAKKGMEEAIEDLNEYLGYKGNDAIVCTIEGPKEDNGVDEQVNVLDMVLTENPAVVCLAAVDMSSCEAQLEAAQEDGIPVVILDSGVESSELTYTFCGTDNRAAGAEAAKRLCEAIGEEGQIAILAHSQLSQSSMDRIEGFQEELTKGHPNVRVVRLGYQPIKEEDLTAKEQVEDALEKYPEIKGYFATNQSTSETVLSVLKEQEKQQIQVVGVDMGEVQKQAILDGTEYGSVCQNPYGMGYATIVAGVRAALGMETDQQIDSGFQWMDQSTITLEEYERYLY